MVVLGARPDEEGAGIGARPDQLELSVIEVGRIYLLEASLLCAVVELQLALSRGQELPFVSRPPLELAAFAV